MMMNADDTSYCGGDLPYVVAPGNSVPLPPTPSLFLPVTDQLASSSFLRSEQLGGSSDNMEANNVPALFAPGSSAATDYYTSFRYGHDRDILQFYPSASHYLATGNPYSHFSQSNFLPSSQQEYYFPTLLDENMASFGATPYAQLGFNSLNYGGYQTYYFPPRGGYAYGHHPPRCQVDGCTADLSKAKRYHRRHRVCEHHSKAPVVITARAIMPQRFCQQCSRFHEVDEFDDTKKSCRQRLADHNRRRRKPKPASTDVPLKKRAQAKRSAPAKDRNSSTNMGTGDVLGTQQELASASKEHGRRSMGLGEVVVTEAVDPKGKAPMTKQQARVPQPNVQQGFPVRSPSGNTVHSPSGNSTCLPERSNIAAQVQEPGLAFQQHYHQQCNILQLGHAGFDLDFDH